MHQVAPWCILFALVHEDAWQPHRVRIVELARHPKDRVVHAHHRLSLQRPEIGARFGLVSLNRASLKRP